MISPSKPRHGEPIVTVRKDNISGVAVGIPTRQFQEFLDELETTMQTTIIDLSTGGDSITGQLALSITKKLQDQIGSGEFITVDTTSFTVDTSFISADLTEA